MSAIGTVKVGNVTLPIQSAGIWAAVNDPYWCDTYNQGKDKDITWGLDVEAEDDDSEHEIYSVYFYHHQLRYPIRRWMEIGGQSLSWNTPFDQVSGEPNGCCYVFEHENIGRASLEFGERDGTKFFVSWKGLCDIHWDEEYGTDVPFELSTWAEFSRVIVRGSETDTESSLRDRLARFLLVDDFVASEMTGEHQYESGVEMRQCTFTPNISPADNKRLDANA